LIRIPRTVRQVEFQDNYNVQVHQSPDLILKLGMIKNEVFVHVNSTLLFNWF